MSDVGTVRLPAAEGERSSFAQQVQHYLSLRPRQLPSRYLYDALGSALFEAICHLPWYPITRAERHLIAANRAEIMEAAGEPEAVLELGSGDGSKLALLLEESAKPRTVHLVDVSASALGAASRRLGELSGLRVIAHEQQYEEGLAHLAARPRGERVLVLFLGSNIGNFDPEGARALLRHARTGLRRGDSFLIGVDLVKPAARLLLAYDDPLGVTAAFNKNLLVRLNETLEADFDLDAFSHLALWNSAESRVEMHLESLLPQQVALPGAGLTFSLEQGERIWTESSYKYETESVHQLLQESGFLPERAWNDPSAHFLLLLSRVV